MASESSSTFKTSVMDRIAVPLILFAGLALYLFTTSGSAFVGQPAELTTVYGGLSPRLSPGQPLWTILTAIVVHWLPFGGLALRMNVLSACLGAVTLCLAYGVISAAIFRTLDVDEKNRRFCVMAARLAGLGTVIAMATSVPFWMGATRPTIAMFNVFWLALTARIYLSYCRRGTKIWLGLFGLAAGMGIVESGLFLVFGPLFMVHMVIGMIERQHVRVKPFIYLCVGGVIGSLMYIVAASMFHQSEGYELMRYGRYLKIYTVMLQSNMAFLRSLSPTVRGNFIYMFMGVVPWVTMLAMCKRSLNGERDWSFYVLHAVLTLVTLLAFVVMPLILRLIDPSWRGLLVYQPFMTYILLSMVFGYLIAYWYLLPFSLLPRDAETPEKLRAHWFGAVVGVFLAAMALAAGLVNFRETNTRPAKFISEFAGEVLDSLEGRNIIVTVGLLDNHLQLLADERGMKDLQIISLAKVRNDVYRSQLKRKYTRAIDRNMLDLGILPMIQHWLKREPDKWVKRLAITRTPDLWLGSGLEMVPHGMLFHGAAALAEVEIDTPVEQQIEHWRDWGKKLAPREGDSYIVARYREMLLQQIGLVANNFGVMLQDLERPDDAFAVYLMVREIYPENVSALLNLGVMVRKGYETPLKEEIEAEIEAIAQDETRRYSLWSLSGLYGYVRDPELFARMGLTWALSGRPGMLNVARRASEMSTGDQKRRYDTLLARQYLRGGESEKSEEIYWQILIDDPENKEALLQLSHITMARGDLEQARELLDRAEAAGVSTARMILQRAVLAIAEDKWADARDALEELVSENPASMQAWSLLVIVAAQQEDLLRIEQAITRMEILSDPRNYLVQIARAQLAAKKNDLTGMRDAYDTALEAQPNSLVVLELALQADMRLADKQTARKRAQQILRLRPDHVLANYVIGSLYLADNKKKQAEVSFRMSIESKRTAFAMNDLAWLLCEDERYDEAEEFAKAATVLNPKMHEAWDTLGVIYMRQGRVGDAEDALNQSLEVYGDNPHAHLHLAMIMFDRGQIAGARRAVEMVEANREMLDSSDQSLLEELAGKLTNR